MTRDLVFQQKSELIPSFHEGSRPGYSYPTHPLDKSGLVQTGPRCGHPWCNRECSHLGPVWTPVQSTLVQQTGGVLGPPCPSLEGGVAAHKVLGLCQFIFRLTRFCPSGNGEHLADDDTVVELCIGMKDKMLTAILRDPATNNTPRPPRATV